MLTAKIAFSDVDLFHKDDISNLKVQLELNLIYSLYTVFISE